VQRVRPVRPVRLVRRGQPERRVRRVRRVRSVRLGRLVRLVPTGRALAAAAAGVVTCFSFPPWGWWPLAFIGIAVFEVGVGATPTGRQRFACGWLFAATWLLIGMCWMWFLSAPGYLVAGAIFATYHGVAELVAGNGRWRVISRPVAHTLAEALRFSFPFGGVPLASLAISQAAGPLLPIVRVGGALLLTWVVFQIGFALGVLVERDTPRLAAIALAAGLVALPIAWVAPSGTNPVSSLRVTVVQGGGPQGTHAVTAGDADKVFARHLQATRTIQAGSTDLVVWPENVIDVPEFVRDDFPSFYRTVFSRREAGERDGAVFLEYAWMVTPNRVSCDPCTAPVLRPEELRSLGAVWVLGPSDLPQPAMLTRLHVRYDARRFPEDLVLQETANRTSWQARYVIHHPYRGSEECSEKTAYWRTVWKRRESEARNYCGLTGANLEVIREKMAVDETWEKPVEKVPWWERIWTE